MVPPNQRLDREHAAGAEIDLRLVEQRELAARQRVIEVLAQPELLADLLIEVGRIKLDAIAAGLFGAIHRRVGVGEQRVHVLAVVGEGRDADAGGHPERVSVDDERAPRPRPGSCAASPKSRQTPSPGRRTG